MNAKNNTKNFVNFHMLLSHSPSCLNRDDMNMQKTAVFGGVKRVRISSQSLKRAMRNSGYYKQLFSKSYRTRYLIDQAVNNLSSKEGADGKAIESVGLIIAALVEGKTKPDEIKKFKRDERTGRIQHQVVPFNKREIEAIEGLVQELATVPESKRIEVAKKRYSETQAEARRSMDLDVALSGRMAASDLSYKSDGALAVAHAFTTHAVEPQDIDWFTAVDDLIEEGGETGAGHLNTQEFSAGVFYRYASLNLKQLQVNLGLLGSMESQENPDSRKRAVEIAKHVFRMLATVVPTAKRQPFAADNLADFAIVSFSELPVSLANAFEKPVERGQGGGYLVPSERRLAEYWQRLNEAYDLNEKAAAFRFDDSPWEEEKRQEKGLLWPDKLYPYGSLAKLEDWIENDGNDKK
jgi:CRISPR system Cascade subunit CasC